MVISPKEETAQHTCSYYLSFISFIFEFNIESKMHHYQAIARSFTKLNPWWIIALGGFSRLVFVFSFLLTTACPNYDPLVGQTAMTTGVDGYVQIARTIVTTGQYAFEPGAPPVPFRPPMQPLLMAVFGAWSPEHWHIIWLTFSVALGTGTLCVLWMCARLTDLPPGLTNLLLLAAALHPYLIFATRVPGIPQALIFMTTLVLFGLLRFSRSNGKQPIQTGMIWGLAALTHGCFLPLLPPMCAILAITLRGNWKVRLGRTALMGATALLIIAPWTLRNQKTFGRWIPVATGGALQYWIADYVYFRKRPDESNAFQRITADFQKNQGRQLNIIHGGILNLTDDEMLVKEAKQQIRSQPSILAARALKGSLLFWTTMDGGLKKAIIVSLMSLPLILLGLGLMVKVIMKRAWTAEYILAVLLMIGYWGLFAMVQAVGPYFVAISPCLLLVIAVGFNLIRNQGTATRAS